MDERDKRAEFNNLRADNERREAALNAQGIGVHPNDALRLNLVALKEVVLGDDPEQHLAFDLAYQRALASTFDQIEAQANRAKLTAPGAVPTNGKGLHIAR